MVYILLVLLSFNFLTLNANELSSRAIDNYHLKIELKRLEYLNDLTKISLRTANNDFSQNNILTVRNSRFSDIIDDSELSAREKIVLNKIDIIAQDLTKNYQDINCSTVTSHSLNDISITLFECLDVDFKTENYYKTRSFDFTIPANGSLNKNAYGVKAIERLNLKASKNTKFIFEKLKKHHKKIWKLEELFLKCHKLN